MTKIPIYKMITTIATTTETMVMVVVVKWATSILLETVGTKNY